MEKNDKPMSKDDITKPLGSPKLEGRTRLMIAVPSRDVWRSDFGMSLAAMTACTVNELPFLDLIFNNAKGCSLAMNRIKLCEDAVNNHCDYILFLDDDMRVPMHTVLMFLKRQVDIIACNCARKEIPPRPTARGFDNGYVQTSQESTGLEKVKSVGTGIMMINCAVFANISTPWFCEDPVKKIGEDVWFCNQARDAGYDIHIDHDLSKDVAHIGEFEYTLQLANEFRDREDD